MSKVTHPKCGKIIPRRIQRRTLLRMLRNGVDRHCEITDKHWTDDRGYYHVGPKLTEEQKAKMWPKEEPE